MKRKYRVKQILEKNNGITGVDVTMAIVVIMVFTGIIANLMYSSYYQSVSIQKSANADAYATIILEKIDEKTYDEVQQESFMELIADEISIDESEFYIDLQIEEIFPQYLKEVILTLNYDIKGETKTLVINKAKVKETEV